MAAASMMAASPAVPLVPEGSQYAPAGSPMGDQLAPSVAFRSNGGCLVWHDNFTDGDGFGVSARRLSGQLSGLSSLRVNEDSVGDQQNPQVVILADGSNLIVWQSGVREAQRILGRVLKANGQFAGPEFQISAEGTDNRNPSLSVSGDNTVFVVWSADGVDGNRTAVQGRMLDASGTPIGQAFQLNQESKFNQRDPVVTTTGDGSLVVVWISEHQRFENSVDVFARRFSANGKAQGDEFVINTSRRPCATATVVGLSGQGFLASWSEHDDSDKRHLWDVMLRVWGDRVAETSPIRINQRQIGVQFFPRLAVIDGLVLAIYRSGGGDGRGEGIVGRWLESDGQFASDEFIVNSKTAGDQMNPTLAGDASGRLIAVWSTFSGISRGMDLAAQRFGRPEVPLPAGPLPYVFAASSSRLLVTWPEVHGFEVAGYEVYVNGSTLAHTTASNSYVLSGLPPSSSTSVRVGYVLTDGRRSALSPSATGVTWGEDDNADGLPDDWQLSFFGTRRELWPSPVDDSDGDGVSNRNEFLSGTNPTSAASLLQVLLVESPQGPLLTWNTMPGGIYQPQWSSNLRDWSDLGSPRLAPSEVDSLPASDTPANSYYRVTFLR
ncbi:MAG: hypothetical protein J0L84_04870 [Verrucomicrobia bacterium]|nr:hypothetical protein [Verrucomicrobiota bacterium]